MDTRQINAILSQELGNVFLGVFARDEIPLHLPPTFAMVVNTHPSNKPGEHWVAFYVDRNIRCVEGEYFDSYGLPPPPDFELLLDRCCLNYKFNRHQLQDYFSFVCGQYCIYYLYHRFHGESLGSICSRLREAGDKNDSIVANFVSQNWGPLPCGGQTCRCLRDFMYT